MAKRLSHSAAPGLFDSSSEASAPVSVAPGLTPEQQQWVRVETDSLQRTIARLQRQLACPLSSERVQEAQIADANVSLAFYLRSVSQWLPADVRSLLLAFLEVRAQIIVRDVEGRK